MKNTKLILILAGILLLTGKSQLSAQRLMEKLNRGMIAVRTNDSQVYIGWRLLGNDPSGISFNLYRGNIKINSTPIINTTNFIDNTSSSNVYTLKPVINGVELTLSESATIWNQQYLEIPLQIPAGGTTPDGVAYTYNANDCSVGDLDGDGEYEIILKWDPSNSKDNSQSGYTGNVYLDAYKMNGSQLWRIDLGKNIRAGAHYTQFMVYDFDSDGKAEIACKTADGTKDGIGTMIGDSAADYRTTAGYVLSGPEFLTVFNGQTGAAMATANFLPARGTVASWGDNYGNRVDRFIAAVAYLDGHRPSLVMGRGYYTRLVRVAWDWRNGQLTNRWIFDSNTPGNGAYASMGNHQMTIGDVDNDGKDEVFNGASAIDDNGSGLYSNGLGHGDALHMTDMDPDVPGQEIWQCHEEPAKYGIYGLEFRNALTGVPVWGVSGGGKDVGRCLAIDIDPRHKGYECWGAVGNLYDCKGNQISNVKPGSTNFAVWWDADLSRELLDGNHIDKWDYNNNTTNRIFTATDCSSNNGTKSNPALSADILGDWREEVILRKTDNSALRIFTTTLPANNRFYTLMHDPQYRAAIAWQNSAYNQPPHPGFYLGDGMSAPPQPVIQIAGKASQNQGNSTSNIPESDFSLVFPNPGNHSFTIKTEGHFSYTIVNELGKNVETGEAEEQYEAGAKLKPGIYLVKVNSKKGTKTVKIVKN
ncbi:rhamnogalacturonan endolyase [Pseudarcicella hirudinis]|uniref:Rhamnogalacturonan endolyase n=1 Tax=Pseudarcicella hirudinis TaxID=1079859 RepID=A0A1I5YW40_9BACT|nr:T9SS type A sorting domain-containing protein [Pseudarcicella hirudinis]SFQ48422.1 rhamnogalacturonan endolyase [Pseudarcicella hirudinis]